MIVSLEIKNKLPFGWCMQQLSAILKINVKINLEVNVADMTKKDLKNRFSIPKFGQDMLLTH